MPSIKPETRVKIKGYLEGFIQGLLDSYITIKTPHSKNTIDYIHQYSKTGDLKPFQAALIPRELIRINQFERSLSTKLGTSIEECAKLIAADIHRQVYRSFDLTMEVSQSALSEIQIQKSRYESSVTNPVKRNIKPSLSEMVVAVLNARKTDDLITKTVRADLYIKDNQTELFFEIKAPKPNKGQCLEVLERLLRFHALCGIDRPKLQAYYAMPYNPYGPEKTDYKWSQALNYLPFNEAVIIGQEFWTMIGNIHTYHELLEIYLEVGEEKRKFIVDTLALNF